MDLTNSMDLQNLALVEELLQLETLQSVRHFLSEDPILEPGLLNPYYQYQVFSS